MYQANIFQFREYVGEILNFIARIIFIIYTYV